jgi:hypothetical protein
MLFFVLAPGMGPAVGAEGQAAAPRQAGMAPPTAVTVAVLNALDRVIRVEFNKATPQQAFALLAHAGGIPIEVDPAVSPDLKVSAILKGVRLGDALTLVSRYCGVRLMPGAQSLLVVPAPVVTVTAPGAAQPSVGQSANNPWAGWAETLNVQLMPGGETGYPRPVRLEVQGIQGGQMLPAQAKCAQCGASLLGFWAFCPFCGQQQLALRPQPGMKFCGGCGRTLPHRGEEQGAPRR